MKKRLTILCIAVGFLIAGVRAHAEGITSEVVKHGENGQVSTIVGNGTASQGTYTVEGPRNIAVGSSGLVYFIDGTNAKAKLRVWDGKKNKTLVDLNGDTVAARGGNLFLSSGLAVVDGNIFVSSQKQVYIVKKNKTESRYLSKLTSVREYMDTHGYDFIYRMEEYDGDLYLMAAYKGGNGYSTYGFIKYDPKTKEVEQVLENKVYPESANNFYVDGDGILISFQTGLIQYEGFYPRKSVEVVRTNTGPILDAWTTSTGYLMYSENNDRLYWTIYTRHRSSSDDAEAYVGGDPRGFTDGLYDQVQLDGATDFVWDGSGYLFADKGNHAIRKLWVDTAPTSAVQ